ncbi:helix-turn-helix domain-containing protein [Streptomyces sp. NPDC056069]|uniref:helix-turn-helix domain-containing protein n=1 Tax=Streptomyces sp. NPDC056069 TaxID=3345702 RepID=UPI0035DEB7D6
MQLGAELERLRTQSGLTMDQVVEGLPVSSSQYYKVSRGTSAFRKQEHLVLVLERLGVTDKDDVAFLVDIHRDSLNRGWWSTYSRNMPSGMAFYVGLEDGARAIRGWQPTVVYGLLQTENYARALFSTAKPVDETKTEYIVRGVEVRMQRKEILTRENPLELRVILAEAALRNVVGNADVMREQYEEIIRLSELDNVTVQILRQGHGTYRCSYDFALMEFGDGLPTVVQMDMIDGGSNITDKDTEIWQFSRRFDALRDGALPVAETPKFLHQLAREI